MKLPEFLFVIALIGGMLVPSAVVGQWWLFSVFLVFFIIFGIIEGVAVWKSKKTVSQHFWEYSKKNKVGAILVLTGMSVAWIALIWHLACKM
jgi:hypothetical protein